MSDNASGNFFDPTAPIGEGTTQAPFSDTTDGPGGDAVALPPSGGDPSAVVNDGPAPVPCFMCGDTGEVHEKTAANCVATKACPACRG